MIIDLPGEGLAALSCVILKRLPMPDRMTWKFTLRGETPTTHAFALGQTAIAPPVPTLRSTADSDGIAAGSVEAIADLQVAVDDHDEQFADQAEQLEVVPSNGIYDFQVVLP